MQLKPRCYKCYRRICQRYVPLYTNLSIWPRRKQTWDTLNGQQNIWKYTRFNSVNIVEIKTGCDDVVTVQLMVTQNHYDPVRNNICSMNLCAFKTFLNNKIVLNFSLYTIHDTRTVHNQW